MEAGCSFEWPIFKPKIGNVHLTGLHGHCKLPSVYHGSSDLGLMAL